MRCQLDRAPRLIPLGIAMGLLMIGLNAVRDVWIAAPFLIVLGAVGGYLVVPMNALLQHRGANLMGAGRSIAVQNFNEQACILGLGALNSGLTLLHLSVYTTITVLGLTVAAMMWLIRRWHAANLRHHPDELARLLRLAGEDGHHPGPTAGRTPMPSPLRVNPTPDPGPGTGGGTGDNAAMLSRPPTPEPLPPRE